MSSYSSSNRENEIEYKILRSASGAFGKPRLLDEVLNQENSYGWELKEKLDDSRLRFWRPVSCRENDKSVASSFGPYRTTYGMSEFKYALLMGAAVFAGMIVLLILQFDFM